MPDLDCGSQPITGPLWPCGDGEPLTFRGWIEIAAVIEDVATGCTDDEEVGAETARERRRGEVS